MSRLLASTALLFLVMACGWNSVSLTYRLATYHPSETSLTARADGVIGGVTNSNGTACLWIGNGSNRTDFIWPDGYHAKGEPLTVYDGSDKKVATVGQKVKFGGGLAPEATPVFGCKGVSNAWIVAPQR